MLLSQSLNFHPQKFMAQLLLIHTLQTAAWKVLILVNNDNHKKVALSAEDSKLVLKKKKVLHLGQEV